VPLPGEGRTGKEKAMPIFKDAEQLSSIVKELWENVLEDEDAAEQVRKAGLSVLTVFRDPEVHLWVGAGKVVAGDEEFESGDRPRDGEGEGKGPCREADSDGRPAQKGL